MPTLATNTAPRFPTDDPAKMSYQDWLEAQGLSDVTAQWIKDELSKYGDLEGMNWEVAWRLYQDLLESPGYTDEERMNILQASGLASLIPSEQMEQDFHLTPEEAEQIRGNVWSRAGYFDPAYAEQLQRTGAEHTKEAWGKGQRAILDALEHGERQAWENLDRGGEAIREALGRGEEGAWRAVEEGAGRIRGALGDYGSRLRSTLSQARTDVLSPFEDPSLVMSDKELSDLVTSAGRKVGASYEAAKEDLLRRAAAEGTVNPLSIAAARARLERQSAVDRAAAMADAELAARAAQRGEKFDVAQARSSGGRYLGTLGTSAESELGQAGLGAERGIAELGTGTAITLGGRRVGAEGDITGLRTGLATTLGGRRLATQQGLTEADVGLTRDLSQEAQNVARFNQTLGTEVMRDVEGTEQARNAAIALNRQGTARDIQNARLSAGGFVYPALSRGYQTVADARRKDLGELRNWATGQQQWAGGMGQNAFNQYLQGQNIALGARGRATGTAADIWQAKNASSFRNKVLYPVIGKWMTDPRKTYESIMGGD